MTYLPPEVAPTELRIGDTLDFVLRAAETPDTWTLMLSLRGPASHDIAAVTYDGAFRITADTTGWTPGAYAWIARATLIADATIKHTVASAADFTLLPNLAVTGTQDAPSHAAKMVALLRTALEGRASRVELQYRLPDGREVQLVPPLELHALLARYEAELGLERQAEAVGAGRRNGRMIVTRFA